MSSWGSSGDSSKNSSSSGSDKPSDTLKGMRPRDLTPYEVQISKDALQRRIDAGGYLMLAAASSSSSLPLPSPRPANTTRQATSRKTTLT